MTPGLQGAMNPGLQGLPADQWTSASAIGAMRNIVAGQNVSPGDASGTYGMHPFTSAGKPYSIHSNVSNGTMEGLDKRPLAGPGTDWLALRAAMAAAKTGRAEAINSAAPSAERTPRTNGLGEWESVPHMPQSCNAGASGSDWMATAPTSDWMATGPAVSGAADAGEEKHGAPPWRSAQITSASLAPPTFSHDSNAGATAGPRLIPPPRLIAPPSYMLNRNAPPPNQMSSARKGLVPSFAYIPSQTNTAQAATERPANAPAEVQPKLGATSSVIRASQLHSLTSPRPVAQRTSAEAAEPMATPPLLAAPPAARPRPSTHTDTGLQDQSSWSEHVEETEPAQVSAWPSQPDNWATANGETNLSRASNCTTTQMWDPATGEYVEDELPDDIKEMMGI